MGLRTSSVIEFCIGHDNSLDEGGDKAFEGNVDEMLDTLDHICSGGYDLEASEQNVVVAFGDVTQGRIVYLEGNGDFRVTFGGVAGIAATLLGAGATYPGSGTLVFNLDGTAVSVVFQAGDLTVAAYVARINAACALAGLATPRAVNESGQIRLNGIDASANGEIEITTALATAGFPTTTTVNGVNPIPGSSPIEVQRPADPSGAQAAEGVTAFLFATLNTSSIVLTNPSTTDAVHIKVAVLGDLTSS